MSRGQGEPEARVLSALWLSFVQGSSSRATEVWVGGPRARSPLTPALWLVLGVMVCI